MPGAHETAASSSWERPLMPPSKHCTEIPQLGFPRNPSTFQKATRAMSGKGQEDYLRITYNLKSILFPTLLCLSSSGRITFSGRLFAAAPMQEIFLPNAKLRSPAGVSLARVFPHPCTQSRIFQPFYSPWHPHICLKLQLWVWTTRYGFSNPLVQHLGGAGKIPDQHLRVSSEGSQNLSVSGDVHSQKHFNCSEFRATILVYLFIKQHYDILGNF